MIVVGLIFMEATVKLPPLDSEIHPWSSQPGNHAIFKFQSLNEDTLTPCRHTQPRPLNGVYIANMHNGVYILTPVTS